MDLLVAERLRNSFEVFRELGKPPKDLITAEQMVEKTYTEEQVKSLCRLFEVHGMDLLPPPGYE